MFRALINVITASLLARVWLITIAIMIISILSISVIVTKRQDEEPVSALFFLRDKTHKASLSRFQIFSWSILIISLIFSLTTVHFYDAYMASQEEQTANISAENRQMNNVETGDKNEKTQIHPQEENENSKSTDTEGENADEGTSSNVLEIVIPTSFFLLLSINLSSFGIATTFDNVGQDTTTANSGNQKDEIDENKKSNGNNKKATSDPPYYFSEIFLEKKGEQISITRFQNFFFTIVLLVAFFIQTIENTKNVASNVIEIQKLSPSFLALLSVSHAGYLGRKFFSKVYPANTQNYDSQNQKTHSDNRDTPTNENDNEKKSQPNVPRDPDGISEKLSKEIEVFIEMELGGKHLHIPYEKGKINTPEQIKSNIKKMIPNINTLSYLRLKQNIDSISMYTGIGDKEYINYLLSNALGKKYNVSSQSGEQVKLSKLQVGDCIEIKKYYEESIMLIVYQIENETVKYSYVCPVYGLHNGTVTVSDWNVQLTNSQQVWHDIGFNAPVLERCEIEIKRFKAEEDRANEHQNSKKDDTKSQTIHKQDYSIKGYDFAVKKNENQLKKLKETGGQFIGRYYYKKDSWKQLQPDEAKHISNLGMDIIAIYESNPTSAHYFTYERGMEDAKTVLELSQYVGQPQGSAVYFTVDYNPAKEDYPLIEKYMKAVYEHLNESQLKIGLYGTYDVVKYFDGKYGIEYLWQTMAWSHGKKYSGACIIQIRDGAQVESMVVDENISTGNYGGFQVGDGKDNGKA